MTQKYKWLIICLVVLFFLPSISSLEEKPIMQMAILLDTSNSMDGLIQQAKTQLWGIVNELSLREKDRLAEFQLALYEYGNSSLSEKEGYIRMVVPFTNDIDRVSEALFSLTTNGGQEYCAWAIDSSIEQLAWSNLYSDYKMIFIAGNEPFDQGKIDFKEASLKALSNGIVVHTIHCGTYEGGVGGYWNQGAWIANGSYTVINQDEKSIEMSSPQDDQIIKLNAQLNQTYIPYGKDGNSRQQRQLQEDQNAQRASAEGYIQRAVFKCSPYYRNTSWDLADAWDEEKSILEKLSSEDLPENLQSMTTFEIKEFLTQNKNKREEICQEIVKLYQERQEYLQKQQPSSKKDTLKAAMVKALEKQLKSYDLNK